MTKAEVKDLISEIEQIELIKPHWIVDTDCEGKTRQLTCSWCGYETGIYQWDNPKYCAQCGEKMSVESEGE